MLYKWKLFFHWSKNCHNFPKAWRESPNQWFWKNEELISPDTFGTDTYEWYAQIFLQAVEDGTGNQRTKGHQKFITKRWGHWLSKRHQHSPRKIWLHKKKIQQTAKNNRLFDGKDGVEGSAWVEKKVNAEYKKKESQKQKVKGQISWTSEEIGKKIRVLFRWKFKSIKFIFIIGITRA